MKILLLLSGLASSTQAVSAQAIVEAPPIKRHLVSVGVFGLAPTLGLEYEQRLGKHLALAVQGARYFSKDYPGYQAALVGRYYFRALAPTGLYAQISAGAFRHDAQVRSEMPGSSGQSGPAKLRGNGAGLGLGYHLPLGPHLSLHAAVGLKFYFHDLGVKCDCSYVGDWYAIGQPGSLLDGQLGIGHAF